ncbi:DNA polymerase catalytic subunit [Falconid herpesvirus 1]|uniref:DNA polymerase n=1 Tax=Falconid herpesvirus 1 TaxID=1510155 RepID=A0A068EVY1_9ALPH|nr:DNA polymerase catalytic subunit [Falconid herpesvirus 1]AID52734.1 DNA polymerase catalytic subunit [Falconid herpesvirus 1]
MEGTTSRTFFNPFLARRSSSGDGLPRGPGTANWGAGTNANASRYSRQRYTYVSEQEEFKFIAPECLDERDGDEGVSSGDDDQPRSYPKGTHVGTLKRSPLAYRDGEVVEFLDFEKSGKLWPRRSRTWGAKTFREDDFDPRFNRFHVYDMVETVETADGALGRDSERFLELIRPLGTVITMLGMTECGKRVAVHVYGVNPYFYMGKDQVDAACGSRCPRDVAEKMAASIRNSITGGGQKQFYGHGFRGASADCFDVDVVQKTDVYFYGTPQKPYYRVKARSGRFVSSVCDNFCQTVTKYEGAVDSVTRMVLDNANFITFGWYRLKIGEQGRRVQVRRPEYHTTSCDVEINCTVDNLEGEPGADEWPDYKLLCFDIECKSSGHNELAFPEATNEEDLVIQISCLLYSLQTRRLEHIILFSLGSCDLSSEFLEGLREKQLPEPTVLEFESEYELLLAFMTFVKQYAPEFATGYNIVNFDWAFIHNKLTTVYDMRLDGYGVLNKGGMFKIWDAGINRFQKKSKVKITGIISLDMYSVATEKAKLPNYKLNTVAAAVLGERKKDLSYKEIPGHFAAGPVKRGVIGEYCLQDSLLVGKLFFKYLPHLELSAVAKLAGILLPRAIYDGQQLRVFTCLLRLASSRGFLLPDNTKRFTDAAMAPVPAGGEDSNPALDGAEGSDDDDERADRDAGSEPAAPKTKSSSSRQVGYQGAKVLEPETGFHVNPVVVFDFASLYPSIIQAHNLCFTTLTLDRSAVDDLRPGDDYLQINVNGKTLYFVKKHVRESLLSILLTDWLAMRKAIRAKIPGSPEDQAVLLDKQQAAIKVVCNSVYGFCGVVNGLLPCLNVAATVTTIGRNMLLAVRDYIHRRWASWDALIKEFPQLDGHAKAGEDYSVSVIYGDTDSVFVKITGVDTAALVSAGDVMGKRISSELFLPPIKLECEKTFDKLLLITKKKYMGTIFGGKMMMKGVDLVRKNNCRFINAYAKRLVDLLFLNDDVAKAAAVITSEPPSTWLERPLPDGLKPFGEVLVEAYDKVAGNKPLDVSEFVMSAELSRPPNAYANKRIAHLTVYYKLCMRADQPPMVKDRISYVIAAECDEIERDAARVAEIRGDAVKDASPASDPVDGDDPSAPQPAKRRRAAAPKKRKLLVSELAEDPGYLMSAGLKLNIDYYFTHLLGTLSVTFKALFGNDTKVTESVLKRFIPESFKESDEDAERLAKAGFAVVRTGAGLDPSEEEESRQRWSTAFRILTAVRRRY